MRESKIVDRRKRRPLRQTPNWSCHMWTRMQTRDGSTYIYIWGGTCDWPRESVKCLTSSKWGDMLDGKPPSGETRAHTQIIFTGKWILCSLGDGRLTGWFRLFLVLWLVSVCLLDTHTLLSNSLIIIRRLGGAVYLMQPTYFAVRRDTASN
jgi:hypothetical protein